MQHDKKEMKKNDTNRRDRKRKSCKSVLIECGQTLRKSEEQKTSLEGIVRDMKGLSEAVDARVENMRSKISRNSAQYGNDNSALFSIEEIISRDRKNMRKVQQSLRSKQRSMEAQNDEISGKLEALAVAKRRAATASGTILRAHEVYIALRYSIVRFWRRLTHVSLCTRYVTFALAVLPVFLWRLWSRIRGTRGSGTRIYCLGGFFVALLFVLRRLWGLSRGRR